MQIHVSEKHRKVALPYREDVANLFGDRAKPITFQDSPHLLVPHDFTSTKFLRTVGFELPAPVSYQYDYNRALIGWREPFEVQRKTVALLTTNQRAYCLNDMGTGKTASAIYAFDYLKRQREATKMLIVAPVSVLTFTWAAEVFKVCPHLKTSVLYGYNKEQRIKALAQDADIYIINHDGVEVMLNELKARLDLDVICIDEFAAYRNAGARRSKTMKKFVRHFKWAWGMTGSPTPNAPTDVWSMANILTPWTVDQYYTHFRDEVMLKVSNFRYVAKKDAVEKAYAALQPAVRYTLEDVTELPEQVHRDVWIEMGPKQKAVYKALKDKASALVGAEQITAMNAAAVYQKLLQVSTGWVYTRDGRTVALDNDERVDAMVDVCLSHSGKGIIFVPFIHALDGISARLKKEKIKHEVVSGNTSINQRNKIFKAFQDDPDPPWLVAHPACMAHGLTLTAANLICWFAPVTSLETFDQANARIRRVGQTRKQQYLYFTSSDAEKKLYAALKNKQNVQGMLLSLFEEAS